MLDVGIVIYDLLFEWVVEVFVIKVIILRFLVNDCFCFVMICCYDGVIFLIGDGFLCGVVVDDGCCVYGVLWVIDEFKCLVFCGDDILVVVLEFWCDDLMV